jgi:ParB-like chromosome segregation protein Spo0J
MARLNDLSHGKLDAPKLDPRDIIIRKGFNYRDTTSPEAIAHMHWLKDSIKEVGVQKPLQVEYDDGKVYLVDGECRLLAARQLWKEGIEVYVPVMQIRGDEAEIRAKSMIANGALPPTMIEFGKAAAQLRDWGWSEGRISQFTPPHVRATKKAGQYVRDALELNDAPLDVKQAVREGIDGVKITPALAVAVSKGNRINAGEILRNEAAKAKAKGKKVAHRPKGEGKATKAAKAAVAKTVDLMEIGDRMASNVLANTSYPAICQLARQWQKARG